MLAPNYRTPYSFQLNVGVQRQLGPRTALTVDYVRNVGLHYLIGIDTNRVGAARFLDKAAALSTISLTNEAFECGTGTDSASIECAIGHGATIADYASFGMDSGISLTSGFPCGGGCAFPGANTNLGQNQMLFPIGRSVYNGLLFSLKSDLGNPLPGIKRVNLVASYALSRFKGLVRDQDFINNATDFDRPLSFFGPTALDRTHQVGVGAVIDFPLAMRVAVATKWGTASPRTLTLPNSGLPGEIFRTDITGDGTVEDVLPGTNVGAFGRDTRVGDLNAVLTNYTSTAAGRLTPAGQALVSAGLFTADQLKRLGGVTPRLALAPNGQVGVSPFFTFDVHISWVLRPSRLWSNVPEVITIEPKVAIFNLFNFQNFDPGGNPISGSLTGLPGSVNGTTRDKRSNLVAPGSASGVNWYGVPRQVEFGIKITF